jgi:hypothetical protein
LGTRSNMSVHSHRRPDRARSPSSDTGAASDGSTNASTHDLRPPGRPQASAWSSPPLTLTHRAPASSFHDG